VLIDAICIFSNAFCPCILNIYGRLVRLVRCNVSTDPYWLLPYKVQRWTKNHREHLSEKDLPCPTVSLPLGGHL